MGIESPIIEVEGDVSGTPGFVRRVGLGAIRLRHRHQAMAERSMAQFAHPSKSLVRCFFSTLSFPLFVFILQL
jgi:hypothetical protein